MRKQIRTSVLLAAITAGAITSSVSMPAWAEENRPTSKLHINYDSEYYYFYHPPSFYDPTAAPASTHEETERTPVSKKYDSAFVKSKTATTATSATAQTASEPVSGPPVQLLPVSVVAPQGEVPATPEQKAAQMQQEFGIPAADLKGLSMQQLTDLDMKIRTIQRLQAQYKVAAETLVHESLDALQKLEWKLQQGR